MRKPSDSRKQLLPTPATTAPAAEEAAVPMIRCVICGSETQAGSAEQMCWVCRRLKISAWHDVEQQVPAQE